MPVRTAPQDLANRIVTRTRLGGGLVSDIEELVNGLGQAAGEAAAAGGGEAAAEAAVAGGEGMGAVAMLPVLILLVSLLYTIHWVESVLLGVAGKIPVFGHAAQGVVHVAFSPFDDMLNAVESAINVMVIPALDGFARAVNWSLQRLGFQHPASTSAPRTHPGNVATQQDIYRIQQQVNQIRNTTDRIQYVTTTKTVTVGVPQNLWDEIHALQDKQAQFQKELNAQRVQLERATDTITSVQRDVERLVRNVHDVRAVATGWQDVEAELATVSSTLSQFMDEQSADLTGVHHQVDQLSPLLLLTSAGVAGLKILRQLEDTPCMCPKFISVPNEVGTALAMYEYLTNG